MPEFRKQEEKWSHYSENDRLRDPVLSVCKIQTRTGANSNNEMACEEGGERGED